MSATEHTLDDLVRATGFSKRQIRFYITKKLVPGAGDSRGPNAVYGEETLQRLRMIGMLKELTIEPTGRTMTLDEIGHALDTLSVEGIESLLAGRAELAILDTDARRPEPPGSAADYLSDMRWKLAAPEPDVLCSAASYSMEPPMFSFRRGGESPSIHEPLSDLLSRLQDLLAELALDSRFAAEATDHPQWLRITTPDLEFHVRKPDDHPARARLAAMAEALARLLEREE